MDQFFLAMTAVSMETKVMLKLEIKKNYQLGASPARFLVSRIF